MARTLQELSEMMVDQLRRRGYYPKDEMEVLLRLGEEMGELFEAVREKRTNEQVGFEIADVFWNLMRLCLVRGIDLETAFLAKVTYNETRPYESG